MTGYVDPLADETLCRRDVPLLQRLGTNVIRTYAIDPTQNHDACMTLLQNAGIYVISDLSEPLTSINRDQPAWNTKLYYTIYERRRRLDQVRQRHRLLRRQRGDQPEEQHCCICLCQGCRPRHQGLCQDEVDPVAGGWICSE